MQWQQQLMSVPSGGNEAFIDQTLWIGAHGSRVGCWIEVGDSLFNTDDPRDGTQRLYYWAENDETGYHEYHAGEDFGGVPRPGRGEFQRYTISWQENEYWVFIAGVHVGTSKQPLPTLRVEAGVEANDVRPRMLVPVRYKSFLFQDDNGRWRPWEVRRQTVNPPARWEWLWPFGIAGFN